MSARRRLALDAAMTLALVVAFNPGWTGIAMHEWLSIALVAPLLFHLLINWEWTLRIARRFMARLMSVSRLNFAVDMALFAAAVTVTVSGLMVAPEPFAPVGIRFQVTPAWHAVHSWSAWLTIGLFAVHGALHWRWIAGMVRRMTQPASESALAPYRVATAPAGSSHGSSRGTRRRDRAAQATKERAAFARGVSLMAVTAVAAVAVLLGVAAATPFVQPSRAAARAKQVAAGARAAGEQVCPQTGCAAAKCHAATHAKASAFYTRAQIAAGTKAGASDKTADKVAAAKTRDVTQLASGAFEGLELPDVHGKVALHASPRPKSTASPAGTPGSGGTSAGGSSGSASSGVRSSSSKGTASLQTCPRTGCQRSSCHADAGQSASTFYN